jgi:hypothetical protein
MDVKAALARLLPVFRGEARLLALLALSGGRAPLERFLEEGDLKEEAALEVLGDLEARGVVVLEEGEVRLAPEGREKPRRKKREPSPTERLAAEHPHVKGLLLRAGREAPKVAQPLGAKAPLALVRACEAALAYEPSRRTSTLVVWLPEVEAWVRAVGQEAVAEALAEAAKAARQPFPYARKLLLSRFGSLKAQEAGEENGEVYF